MPQDLSSKNRLETDVLFLHQQANKQRCAVAFEAKLAPQLAGSDMGWPGTKVERSKN